MRRRGVLHLLGTARPENAAIARIVGALAGRMAPEGFAVHAWFLGSDGPLAAELRRSGAQVRVVGWEGGAGDPIGAFRFWSALRGTGFAIVHQHAGARAPRWLVRRATDAKIVAHLHGYVSESRGPLRSRIPVEDADCVIGTSRAVLEQAGGVQGRVVYPGVAAPRQAPTRRNGGGETLGAACRLVAVKGLAYLIRALALLRAEFPDLRLEIAGAGPERPSLEQEARCLGLAGRISFLGWRPDVPTLMRGWDVFAMPSLAEGLGIAALEAMAAGLPVVASAAGGLREVVEDGRTGWLVAPGDPGALAARLRGLLLDPQRRRAMGVAGLARVREHFSIERMVSETARIYRDILEFHE